MYTEEIDFPFLRLLFECRVIGPLLYLTNRRGETIKGLISDEMKKMFPCNQSLSCNNCTLVDDPKNCDYVRFFRYDLCDRPFNYVIIPPLNPRSVYHNNDKLCFEIRLFGECARLDYLIKYLAPAIEQGGLLTGIGNWYKDFNQHMGRFQLSRIYNWQNNDWMKVFQEEDGFQRNDIYVQWFQKEYSLTHEECNEVRFYTPFCFKRSKSIISEPAFKDIVYFSIMRLRSVYSDRTLKLEDDIYNDLDFIQIVSSQFEETFTAKDSKYFIGNMRFDSLGKEIIPLLKLGSLCHLGKGTTQGYGGFFIPSSPS